MTEDRPRPGPSKREQLRRSGYFDDRRRALEALAPRQRRIVGLHQIVNLPTYDPSGSRSDRSRELRKMIKAYEAEVARLAGALQDLRDELTQVSLKT